MHIEREVREQNDQNRKKAEELSLIVHKGQEGERKELIEVQIKLSQLEQEKAIKDEYHSKQVMDMK